jgi:hypothetical protein
MEKSILMAICYDFDGTLSPGNMQEYDFFRGLEITPRQFWAEAKKIAKEQSADPVLVYMKLMIDKAGRAGGMRIDKEAFAQYGRSVGLFKGVEDWFGRIDSYAKGKGALMEHYIISSGIREMIEGTSIARNFKDIFASSFIYDENGEAKWPAMAINYTNKTQYLFRINKGIEDITENKDVNKHLPHNQRRIPFIRMAYLGDGDTDVPCMKLVKEKGGYSIAVYPDSKPAKVHDVQDLLAQGRVNAVAKADYSEGSRLERLIMAFIDHSIADSRLEAVSSEPWNG